MITLTKLSIYKEYFYKIDHPSGKFNQIPEGLSASEWDLITKLLGDLETSRSKLISAELKYRIFQEIETSCESKEVIAELEQMSIKYR